MSIGEYEMKKIQTDFLTANDIIWGSADTCMRICGIDKRRLRQLANQGVIRARKFGDTVQSPTVFRVSDICDWIEEQPQAQFKYVRLESEEFSA